MCSQWVERVGEFVHFTKLNLFQTKSDMRLVRNGVRFVGYFLNLTMLGVFVASPF
jgi:hypothetical protein